MNLVIGDTIEIKFNGDKKAKQYIVTVDGLYLQLRNMEIKPPKKEYLTIKRISH